MVRVVSTVGLPSNMMEGLDGWSGSEFSETTQDLLDRLDVPVPEVVTRQAVEVPTGIVEECVTPRPGRRKRSVLTTAASMRDKVLAMKRRKA